MLVQAVRSTFPPDGRRPYYTYSMQDDQDALRSLRLAIYAGDEADYVRLLDLYNKDYNPARGPHTLEKLFLRTPVDLGWLVRRSMAIQYGIFFPLAGVGYLPGQTPTGPYPGGQNAQTLGLTGGDGCGLHYPWFILGVPV